MQTHLKKQLDVINNTFQKKKIKKADTLVRECLATLKNNNRIIATALGKNEPVAKKFVSTLNSVGIDSHFLNTSAAIHGDIGIIRANDLVIMISKTGETEETILLASLLKKRNSQNWILTCNVNVSVGKHIKNIISLPISHEGDPWNLMPNNSTVVFLIFLQALAMELIQKLRIPLSLYKANHPGGGIGKILRNEN